MTRSYSVESPAVEVVPVIVTTVADPTGGAVEFAFTSANTDPSSFTAGAWSGTWSATTGRVVALTPTLPASGATVPLAEGRWTVWCRFAVGGETVVERVGQLVVA
jgi:hypothetical protein